MSLQDDFGPDEGTGGLGPLELDDLLGPDTGYGEEPNEFNFEQKTFGQQAQMEEGPLNFSEDNLENNRHEMRMLLLEQEQQRLKNSEYFQSLAKKRANY
jgi:hypothetical protein